MEEGYGRWMILRCGCRDLSHGATLAQRRHAFSSIGIVTYDFKASGSDIRDKTRLVQ
jgi:hypothetical protein